MPPRVTYTPVSNRVVAAMHRVLCSQLRHPAWGGGEPERYRELLEAMRTNARAEMETPTASISTAEGCTLLVARTPPGEAAGRGGSPYAVHLTVRCLNMDAVDTITELATNNGGWAMK